MAGGWSANLHFYDIHQSLGINILGVGGEKATLTCRLKLYSNRVCEFVVIVPDADGQSGGEID